MPSRSGRRRRSQSRNSDSRRHRRPSASDYSQSSFETESTLQNMDYSRSVYTPDSSRHSGSSRGDHRPNLAALRDTAPQYASPMDRFQRESGPWSELNTRTGNSSRGAFPQVHTSIHNPIWQVQPDGRDPTPPLLLRNSEPSSYTGRGEPSRASTLHSSNPRLPANVILVQPRRDPVPPRRNDSYSMDVGFRREFVPPRRVGSYSMDVGPRLSRIPTFTPEYDSEEDEYSSSRRSDRSRRNDRDRRR